MTEKLKAPMLRFPGFVGDWEERKFGDIVSRESIAKESSFEYPYVEYEDVVSEEGRLNKDIRQKEGTKKGIVFDGSQVLYGKLRPYLHNWLNPDFSGVAVGDWWVLKPIDTDKNFIFRLIQTPQFDDISNLSAGSKMPRADWSLVSNTVFSIPAAKAEQSKIGSYFSNLDNLISVHRRKLEKIKTIKKAMLQKMFPKAGEKFPEIRFPEFTEAWEQRKLGDIADIVGGGTPSTSKSEYWDGDIDWYAPAEIADQIYVDSSERKITYSGFKNSSAKKLPIGTVLFTSRAGIGKVAILRKEACTNQGFQSIVPHEHELDSYFIFSRSNELKRYAETVGAGSTFVEVSGKQMSAMTLMMPVGIEEQKKIGEYFSNLDSLINLHQRKLDTLKTLKKGFLQQMFV